MKHCPNCGAEYEDLARECMDCRVALEAGPGVTPTHGDPDVKLVVIQSFSGYTAAANAQLNKNLLEAEGIPCAVTGATSSPFSKAESDVRLLVREDDVQRAVQILESCSDVDPLTDDAS